MTRRSLVVVPIAFLLFTLVSAGGWTDFWMNSFPLHDTDALVSSWGFYRELDYGLTGSDDIQLLPLPVYQASRAYWILAPDSAGLAWASDSPLTDPTPNVNVVPQEMLGVGSNEKGRWAAYMKFYGRVKPSPGQAHAGIFLRVNERSDNGSKDWGLDLPYGDQTRIGCIVQANGMGGIEYIADSDANPNEGLGAVQDFPLSESPFDHLGTLYELRIEEWKSLNGVLHWQASVWKVSNNSCLGSSDVITATGGDGSLVPVENDWGPDRTLRVPGLWDTTHDGETVSSRIAFGFHGASGRIDINRVGTRYWTY